ncbi:MAG: dihydrofolate reductase [Desertimonas sp.]
MTIIQIAAVATNGAIGADGGLPWHLPEDFEHFKRTTLGHVLVMGRATFESIGRPLPDRTTIVLTRNPRWSPPVGVWVAGSIDEALARAVELDDEVYIAGGAAVYAAAMPHSDVLVISEIPLCPPADTFFPPIDPSVWHEAERRHHDGFDVVRWERRPTM